MGSSADKSEQVNLFVPVPAELVAAEPLTAAERWLKFRRADGESVDHAPGQFLQISVFGFEEAPISVCSAQVPGDPAFELCVRRMGRLTGALHELPVGGTVGIRGPYGRGFDTAGMENKDILFVAGGIGLAPMRSLIQHCLARRRHYGHLTLLYGCKLPPEILFGEDLAAWKEAPDFDVQLIVDVGDEGWAGPTGLITTLIPPLAFDPGGTVAVLVGPPVMYRFVVKELRARGLADQRIFLSLERHMRCGVGKCGHCMIGLLRCCVDGPVFALPELADIPEAI